MLRSSWTPSIVASDEKSSATPIKVFATEYRAKSAEGKVRHPFFKGLREDL